MKQISHHIHADMLADYAHGRLDYATSLVVATHMSVCDICRAEVETTDMLGGALLDDMEPAQPSATFEDSILSAIHTAPVIPRTPARGAYPQPVMEALNGKDPSWSSLGPGIRQHVISRDKKSSVRLLWIDAGKPVPEHSHKGQELTLVLQGAFGDQTGEFHAGDVEVADGDLEHQPVALDGMPCICLSSTSDDLIFKSILPRMLQPIFGI